MENVLNVDLMTSGEWLIGDGRKNVKGYIDIPEFSIGELDDLQVNHMQQCETIS